MPQPWQARREAPVPGDVERLLASVPEWFGRPESNTEYVEAARTKETWVAGTRCRCWDGSHPQHAG